MERPPVLTPVCNVFNKRSDDTDYDRAENN